MVMKRTQETLDEGRGFRPLAAARHRRQPPGDRDRADGGLPAAPCSAPATIYADEDFAAIELLGSLMMLHADHSYLDHEMAGVVDGAEMRGLGIEIRLYGADPDQAEARARRSATSCWPARWTSRMACANATSSDRTATCSCRAGSAAGRQLRICNMRRKPYFNHIRLKFRQHRHLFGDCDLMRSGRSAPTEVGMIFSKAAWSPYRWPRLLASGCSSIAVFLRWTTSPRRCTPAPSGHGDRQPAAAAGRARHRRRSQFPAAPGDSQVAAPPARPAAGQRARPDRRPASPASGTPRVSGQSCKVATPQTKFGAGYRAGPLRCPAPIDGVKSWNVAGKQLDAL